MEESLKTLMTLKLTVKQNDCPGILRWAGAKLATFKITAANDPIFNAVMDVRNELNKKSSILLNKN